MNRPSQQSTRTPVLQGSLLVSMLLAGTSLNMALAQDPVAPKHSYMTSTVLSGNALSGVSGVANLNMAAGDNNLQSNSGAIAMGDYARVSDFLVQQALLNNGLAPDQATVRIKDNAFDHATGWITVNQAAGQTNVQSNSMGVALGIKGSSLSNASLGRVLSNQQVLTGDPETEAPERQIEIEGTTFSGARGIIQVNQSAGTGNATRNSFSLRVGP